MKILNEKTLLGWLGLTQADREGFLRKCSKNGRFRRRYFVLQGNVLAYYAERRPALAAFSVLGEVASSTSPTSMAPLGVLFLEGQVVEIAENCGEPYAFSIEFAGEDSKTSRPFILAGESQVEMKEWMVSIMNANYLTFRISMENAEAQCRALQTLEGTTSSPHSPADGTAIKSSRSNPFLPLPADSHSGSSSPKPSRAHAGHHGCDDHSNSVHQLVSLNYPQLSALVGEYWRKMCQT